MVWAEAAGYVWTDVKKTGLVYWLVSGWCVCYWQEVRSLTEGLQRARVRASALTDNLPLRVDTYVLRRHTLPVTSADGSVCVYIWDD